MLAVGVPLTIQESHSPQPDHNSSCILGIKFGTLLGLEDCCANLHPSFGQFTVFKLAPWKPNNRGLLTADYST